MNRLLFVIFFIFAFSLCGYAQEECSDPNIRAVFKEKFKELDVSPPDIPKDATVIFYKSDLPQVQWVGLSWAPSRGALLAYDCHGKLLSIQRTGGVRSIQFFNAPLTPSVSIEEILTGSGYSEIKYSIFALNQGKILEVWNHKKSVSNFMKADDDGFVDLFEFQPVISGNSDYVGDNSGWKGITVEGIRKVYPVNEEDYRVKKLPTQSYCWSAGKKTYVICK